MFSRSSTDPTYIQYDEGYSTPTDMFVYIGPKSTILQLLKKYRERIYIPPTTAAQESLGRYCKRNKTKKGKEKKNTRKTYGSQ